MVALLLPILLGVAGIAIDMGNMYLTHTRLQAAVDAGALAGSLELPYDPDLSKGIVRQAVDDMVAANMDSAEVTVVQAGTEVRSVEVTAQAEVNLLLMGILGMSDQVVEASAAAGFNKLEVVFVIDNSGSMKGTPITMVKEASIALTDLLIPDGASPDTKVGLVAFQGQGPHRRRRRRSRAGLLQRGRHPERGHPRRLHGRLLGAVLLPAAAGLPGHLLQPARGPAPEQGQVPHHLLHQHPVRHRHLVRHGHPRRHQVGTAHPDARGPRSPRAATRKTTARS